MSIYKKLLEIQKKVKGLSKDKKSHNYEYVTGNKLLSFIKPIMDESGLILKQEVLSIDNERQDYKVWDKWFQNQDGTKGAWKPKSEILSKVMMRFTWIDTETGEKDENLFGANGQNDWEKGLGSALTYAERYFLLKYFHIATDEDDIDNPDRKPEDKAPKKEPLKQNTITIPPAVLKDVTSKLNASKTQDELSELYKKEISTINRYPSLKAMFTNRKTAINGN